MSPSIRQVASALRHRAITHLVAVALGALATFSIRTAAVASAARSEARSFVVGISRATAQEMLSPLQEWERVHEAETRALRPVMIGWKDAQDLRSARIEQRQIEQGEILAALCAKTHCR